MKIHKNAEFIPDLFLIGLIFDISGHFQAAIFAMLAIVMLMIGVQLSMKLGGKREEGSSS